jgi:hypothetical protein
MKILKKDGTIEEGVGITDEQATEMERTESVLHDVICQNSRHYDWQSFPKCRKVASEVATGASLIDALEGLMLKPIAVPNTLAEPAPEKEGEQ